MREVVDVFLKKSGVSSVSLLSYRRDLEKLLAHFSRHPEAAKREELIDYFTKQGKELSPSSLSRQVSVVRSFYSFLEKERRISENPMEGVSAASFEKKEGEVLDREEFIRLIEHSVPGFRGIRDRAMLMLLCETGMRVTELVELSRSDLQEGCVLCGRDSRRRSVSISPGLRDTLSQYLAVRALYAEEDGALFVTSRGAKMTRQGFWKNLKERAVYSGIDKTISPHTLRRSLALHWMEEGKAREEITRILGNADPASLRNYKIAKKGEQNGSV